MALPGTVVKSEPDDSLPAGSPVVRPEPQQQPEGHVAEFAVPDKPVRKPTLAAKELQLAADCQHRQAGPPGRQGAWKPGPGRGYKRKGLLLELPASTALAVAKARPSLLPPLPKASPGCLPGIVASRLLLASRGWTSALSRGMSTA